MGAIAGYGVPLVAGMLGNKKSKKDQNAARDARDKAGALTNQYMDTYNTFHGIQDTNNPLVNGKMTGAYDPYEFAVRSMMNQAAQGYGTAETNAQRGAMVDAIDRAYQARQGAANEALTKAGFDPNSGTFLRTMGRLNEDRALGQQTAARDLFLSGEELKRTQQGNLANMGMQLRSDPLNAANAQQGVSQAYQNSADATQNMYAGLAGTIGMMQGMGGGTQQQEPAPGPGSNLTRFMPQSQPTVPGQNATYQTPFAIGWQNMANNVYANRPANTSVNQPPSFGSMTSNPGGYSFNPFSYVNKRLDKYKPIYGGNPNGPL